MPIVGDCSCQSPLGGFYEEFFPDKTSQPDLAEVYQENLYRKRDLPATRTIVQSLSDVKHRVVFWFFLPRLWRRTTAPPFPPCWKTGLTSPDAPALHTAFCAVLRASRVTSETKSGRIGTQCVVKRDKRTLGACS